MNTIYKIYLYINTLYPIKILKILQITFMPKSYIYIYINVILRALSIDKFDI